jgi:hypothetical protein
LYWEEENHQKWPNRRSIVLSNQGDYNTRCYIPTKDLVTPPTNRIQAGLAREFGDLDKVLQIKDRSDFIFFKGQLLGTGLVTRLRIRKQKNLFPQNDEEGKVKFQSNEEYLVSIAKSKFCLIMRGTVGWSYRMFDAVYAGCLPVVISVTTHFAFQQIFDFHQFAIFFKDNEMDKIESVLMAIPEEQL